MPIRQDRVIALLEEYERLRDELIRVKKEVGELGAHAQAIATFGTEPRVVELVVEALIIFQRPMPATDMLSVERYHYKKFARVNDRKRARLSARRRAGLTDAFSVKDILDEPVLDREAIDKGKTKEELDAERAEDDATEQALRKEFRND